MAEPEILSDLFVLELANSIGLLQVSAEDLSVILGFNLAAGENAAIMGNVMLRPQAAIRSLISKYVMKHGRDSVSALNLRSIFLNKSIKSPADLIEKELRKHRISVPDHADAVMGHVPNLPSPPRDKPGCESVPVASTQGQTSEPRGYRHEPSGQAHEPQRPPSTTDRNFTYMYIAAAIILAVAFIYMNFM